MPRENNRGAVSYAKFFTSPPRRIRLFLMRLEAVLEDSLVVFESRRQSQKKVVLTTAFIIVRGAEHSSARGMLFKELSYNLKFQKYKAQSSTDVNHPSGSGFYLIDSQQKKTLLLFADPRRADVWMQYLSGVIVERGFHRQYKTIEQIGKGSTAMVYSIRRLRDGAVMSAKVFGKSYLTEVCKREELTSQIQILRELRHPNILKIDKIIQSQTSCCLLSELLEGGSLLKYFNDHQGIPVCQTKIIMKNLMRGIAYLHHYGIMHRDIKMQNIVLRSVQSLEAVIVDFGLAAVSEDEPYLCYRSGTPGYIAPEIMGMKGKKSIDIKCDIFSAGVVLHVMLTNAYLFDGKTSEQLYESNSQCKFNLESPAYEFVDREGMDLLRRMLVVDPGNRISAEDCLLHPFIAGEEGDREEYHLERINS